MASQEQLYKQKSKESNEKNRQEAEEYQAGCEQSEADVAARAEHHEKVDEEADAMLDKIDLVFSINEVIAAKHFHTSLGYAAVHAA